MANKNNETKRDLTVLSNGLAISDSEYVRLVSLISDTWEKAKGRAALAVNTELLDANWQTGRYIVEFEQGGNTKARYGEQLITNLAKDLTRLRGKGFSRSNLFNMRLFYVRFPKIQTVSGQLTWSHYFELLITEGTFVTYIYTIRGQKVMLDFDLAAMYRVETRAMNQAVKRNIERFPDDFMFQLTKGEFVFLKSQIATSNSTDIQSNRVLMSQNVISKPIERRGGTQKLLCLF